jgi:hypothetical protein
VVRESISEEVNLSLEVIRLSSGGYSTITDVDRIGFFLGGNKILSGIPVVSTFGLDKSDFALMRPLEECPRGYMEEVADFIGSKVFIH